MPDHRVRTALRLDPYRVDLNRSAGESISCTVAVVTRWTWAWIGSLVVLVALILSVPAFGQCGSSESGSVADQCSTSSVLGLHRSGDSEDLLAAYKIWMLVCLAALITFVVLDVRARHARRQKLNTAP